MKDLVFPLLAAEDIEVRIGNFNKEKTKCTLLLYKTARTDAKYLDAQVGPFNWQKKFYELKGVIYCSLGIYCEDRKEFIWKDDAGAETQIETEKGTASDAFKRAGFAWGLGRELYSCPTIWVDNPNAYTDFEVKFISYDDKKRIKDLVITAKNKNNNYQVEQLFPKEKKTSQNAQNQAKKDNGIIYADDIKVGDTFLNNEKGSITEEQKRALDIYVSGLNPVSHDRFFVRLDQKYGVGSIDFLSEEQAQEIINKI